MSLMSGKRTPSISRRDRGERLGCRAETDVQSRVMNALRHLLLRKGIATQCLWGFILIALLCRALVSGAVMLDPGRPDSSAVVLCSGGGPLNLDATALTALTARIDADAPITPANDASAIVAALKHQAHANESNASDHSVCAFSAALFAALAPFALLVLLFPAASARRLRLTSILVPIARSALDERPPSRAPPVIG